MDLKSALIPGLLGTKEGALEQWRRNTAGLLTSLKIQKYVYLSFVAIMIMISLLMIFDVFDEVSAFFINLLK